MVMGPAITLLASVVFSIAVQADNAPACSYTTPNLSIMYGTCLSVGSAQIESQHRLYITNICSDPSVGILRWAFPDRDCMLYQHTL